MAIRASEAFAAYGDPDYDPHEDRVVRHPLTNTAAFLSVVKALIGTGILAAPMTFHNAGWLLGICATIALGIIIIYSKLILLSGMYEMERRRNVALLSYSDAMEEATLSGPPCLQWCTNLMHCLVSVLLFVYHFGVCCVYVVFTANCLKDIGDAYFTPEDIRLYILAMLVPFVLIYMVPNLKALVPYVIAANISLVIGFGIIFYYILSERKDFSELEAFAPIHRWPLYLGSALFAFDSPGVIVAIEANMKTPKAYYGYKGIMSQGTVLVVVFQSVFAFCGYWHAGEDVKSTVLQLLPAKDIAALVARVIFVVAIYLSYPLHGYVPLDIFWLSWLKFKVSVSKRRFVEVVIRIALAVYTVLVSLICPNLTMILSFIGAFSVSILGLVLPAMLNICVKYSTGYGPIKIHLILSMLLGVFGLICCITGTVTPIFQLVELYTISPDVAERIL